MRLFSKTNLIFAVIFIGVVFLLIAPLPAKAQLFPSVSDIVGGIVDIIGYAINFVFGLILIFAGKAVDIMLQLNFDILKSSNKIVLIGWTIVRDLTNLGFVLLSIIIAIATIIRYQEYAAKTLLPKLIAVAILVNFSLVIAGAVIQFSNVLTNFFISQATQGRSYSESLGGILNPQKILSPNPDPEPPDPQTSGSGFASLIIRIATVAFNIAFTAIAAITMLAFAFMLLLRYIYLSFLLILVPFICLSYVFPALKEYWSKWMTSFTKWLLFAPALSFFVYLAFVAAEQFSVNPIIKSAAISGGFKDLFDIGIQMIVLCGILLGGLITAESMGIMGASAALGAAKGLGNGAKQWAGNKARRGAAVVAKSVPGKYISGKLVKTGEDLKKVSAKEETKSIFTKEGWSRGNWRKIARNVISAPIRKPISGLGKMASETGKNIQKTDVDKMPNSVSLMGSMLRGAGKGAGLDIGKTKEIKDEGKTKDQLKKEIDARKQVRDEMSKNGSSTVLIDEQIKKLQSEFNKIRENEIHVELSGVEDVSEKLKGLIKDREELNNKPDTPKRKDDLESLNFKIKVTASIAEQQQKAQAQIDKALGKEQGGGLETKNFNVEDAKKAGENKKIIV